MQMCIRDRDSRRIHFTDELQFTNSNMVGEVGTPTSPTILFGINIKNRIR